MLDGNPFPGTEKRIAPLRSHCGAALPGQTAVVYDPDSRLVLDIVAGEDVHVTGRVLAGALLSRAEAGQVWVADRHFCTPAVLEGRAEADACFVVREHVNHPRLAARGPWRDGGRVETGTVCEQVITVAGHATSWRCVELTLDVPTDAGDTVIRIWSNLSDTVSAGQIARTYKHRWNIEGLFGRLESVLRSEIASLGQPRAACLAFAAAVLAYNVLAFVARCVERAHAPAPPVSLSSSRCTSAAASTACRSPCCPNTGPARSRAAWRASSSAGCNWPAISTPNSPQKPLDKRWGVPPPPAQSAKGLR